MTLIEPLVVQAAAWYGPYSVGGTEIFVEDLVSGLSSRHVQSHVIAPRPPGAPTTWRHAGVEVASWPAVSEVGASESLKAFRNVLQDLRPAIYHQHSWTPDCGADHLRVAHELGLKTVLTVHIASYTCLRGSMMRFGREACDGKVRKRLCAACWAQGQGAPRALAEALAFMPPVASRIPGRLGTALSAPSLAAERLEDVAEMAANSNQVVAVSQWLYNTLALNGVGPDKLSLSRQGVGSAFLQQIESLPTTRRSPGPLRLVYLGRWHSVKGLDVVVRALRSLPDAAVELTIYGVGDGPEVRAYRAMISDLSQGDDRIRLAAPLAREAIPAAMQRHDVMVVPSVCLETGPLVALEAQAAGLFVLGSNIGGIAELIDDSSKGATVEAGNVAAWASAISALTSNVPHGRRQPVRTMDACAADMARLYGELA